MPAVITPSPVYDAATPITRSVAGERMMMDGGANPLSTVLQQLADLAMFGAACGNGALVWSGQMWAQGTAAAPQVWIGNIDTVVLPRAATATTFDVLSGGKVTIGAAEIEGGGPLAASTWYYVYLWNNAGTLAYQISTTPPTNAGTPGILEEFKQGTLTHRYLGCFRNATDPIPVRRAGGRYSYVHDVAAANTNVAHAAPGGGGWTTASCAAVVPPHAFVCHLTCNVGDAGGTLGYAGLATTPGGAVFRYVYAYAIPAGHSGGEACGIRMVLNTSQQFDWDCSIDIDVWVEGFEE